MRRMFLLALTALMLSSPAYAGFNLAVSIGEGLDIYDDGGVDRGRFNLEVIPAYNLGVDPLFIKFDLGIHFFAERPVELTFRPGIRFGIPYIYARGAVPLKVNNGFDWGFLAGLGSEFISFGFVSLFLEVDTFFTRELDWVNPLRLEFRAGVAFEF